MTITYDVSQNGRRIDTYPKEVLDIKQTIDYFERLKEDNRIIPGAVEIVHFKNVNDFKISYSESNNITQSYQEPKTTRMINMTIFVCETNLAYGIGRMLQTLHEITNPNHKVLIVKSEKELEKVFKNF